MNKKYPEFYVLSTKKRIFKKFIKTLNEKTGSDWNGKAWGHYYGINMYGQSDGNIKTFGKIVSPEEGIRILNGVLFDL